MNESNPILNSLYQEPRWHYATDLQGNLNYEDVRKDRRFKGSTIMFIVEIIVVNKQYKVDKKLCADTYWIPIVNTV